MWIDSLNFIQSVNNVSLIFRVLSSGRINPSTTKYFDIPTMFSNSAKLNNVNPGVVRTLFEAMISDMARWTKDISIPYRIKLAQGQAKDDEYVLLKLKDMPRRNNVFGGIGFEDITTAVQSGVAMTLNNIPMRDSPLEQLAKL